MSKIILPEEKKIVEPTEREIMMAAQRISFGLEEKNLLLKAAGEIMLKDYDPTVKIRAEKVHYFPHVVGKPGVFTFNW